MKQDLSSLGVGKVEPIVNFAEAALMGYYFCSACQRVTKKVQRGVQFVCIRCGSSRVKFCPPISV
jgi:predicted RNA-binding Zn-ribbon protein involved in translation (DUF1610 family)